MTLEHTDLEFSSCIVVADTHITQETECSSLGLLLKTAQEKNCPVFFLGDFVNLWFESEKLAKAYDTDFTLIREHIERSGPCYFIPGNRDFLAGRIFRQKTGLTVLGEITDITVSEIPYRLLHGDQIFLGDRNYRIYRRLVRNSVIRFLLNTMPDLILRGIASLLERDPKVPEEDRKIPLHLKRFNKFVYSPSIRNYICGHVHRTMTVTEQISGSTAVIQAVSSWIEGGSEYIFIDKDGISIRTL